MPGKRKKYNARFPPARIKKIMQSDEEIGKVAAAVPVIISRALELFVESVLTSAAQITMLRQARTLTPHHLRQCIIREKRFDFLQDLFSSIPDGSQDDESEADSSTPSTPISSMPLTDKDCFDSTAETAVRSSFGAPRGRRRDTRCSIRSRYSVRSTERQFENSKPVQYRGRPRGRPPKFRSCIMIEKVESIGLESEDDLELDLDSESENSLNNDDDDNDIRPVSSNQVAESNEKMVEDLKKEQTSSPSPSCSSFSLPHGIQITIPGMPGLGISTNCSDSSQSTNSNFVSPISNGATSLNNFSEGTVNEFIPGVEASKTCASIGAIEEPVKSLLQGEEGFGTPTSSSPSVSHALKFSSFYSSTPSVDIDEDYDN